jgi:hypothetical protein
LTSKTPKPPDSHDENKRHSHVDESSSSSNSNSIGGNSSGSGLRNVMMMGLVSFFTDLSTEMVLGVLPLFVIKDLGASSNPWSNGGLSRTF